MVDLPLVSPLDRVLFLRAQPSFAEVDPAVLVAIACNSEERSFRKGEVVVDEAAWAGSIHFLVKGTVRSTVGVGTPVDVSAPGGVGLVRRLARKTELTSAVALIDVVTLRIEIDSFLQIMEDHFQVVLALIQNLSRLIAEAEARLDLAPGGDTCVDCQEPASDETLDMVQRLSRARRAPLFRAANLTMLTELLRGTRESYVEAGSWLFRAGQRPDALYLIIEGAVRIENASGTKIAYAGPGDVVALADFCRDEPHAWGAVTETAVQLLRIDKSHYIDVLEDHFDHALDLLAELANRHLELGALDPGDGIGS